jgi:hypothetical protein
LLLSLDLELLLVFLRLLARALGWHLHLTFAVAGVATVPTVKALGRKTPDALTTEITVCGDFECLRSEIVVLGS